jgi:uncharacterized RDD family membrane protein YckC
MAVFYCPSCQYLKTVEDKHLGKSASCPKCKTRGTVGKAEHLIAPRTDESSGNAPNHESQQAVPSLAGLWPRIGGRVIDCIVGFVVAVALTVVTNGAIEPYLLLVITGLMAVYIWKWQATPGMMAVSARFVDASTHQPPTLVRCVIRCFAEWLSAIPLGLGFVWAIFDKRRQTWHDKLANTLVVKSHGLVASADPRSQPLPTREGVSRPQARQTQSPVTASQEGDGPQTATGQDPFLAGNPLYRKAKRVNEGMHRFHKYSKIAAYLCVGVAIWVNDLADQWVGWLCTKVDTATQSTAYQWTMGWVTPAPPAVSPIYNTYNFVMSVLGVAGIAWVSRWFFWTTLMLLLEEEKRYEKGGVPALMMMIAGLWGAEYLIAGGVARFLFGSISPFAIPWWPSPLAWLMAIVAFGVVRYLESVTVTESS